MATYRERLAFADAWRRHAMRARAYLQNAGHGLYAELDGKSAIDYEPVAYWNLLEQAISTAAEIVKEMPAAMFATEDMPDMFGLGEIRGFNASDDWLERARELVSEIERRRGAANKDRRIALLENVAGRTPEEAAAFVRKAEELRRKHGA